MCSNNNDNDSDSSNKPSSLAVPTLNSADLFTRRQHGIRQYRVKNNVPDFLNVLVLEKSSSYWAGVIRGGGGL